MPTDAVLLCYRAGFVGWALVRSAIATPSLLWAGLWWQSTHAPRLDWIVLALGWPFCLALQYLVATMWIKQVPSPLSCNNDLRSMPDLTMWLMLHYLVLMYSRSIALRRPAPESLWQALWPGWWRALCNVSYLVGVPAVLVWSHNTTVPFALAGAGFGTATGLLHAVMYLLVWRPRLDAVDALIAQLKAWRPEKHYHVPAFDDNNNRDAAIYEDTGVSAPDDNTKDLRDTSTVNV